VELTVTVTNQVYHDELQNRSSEEFKKFNETFSEQVNLGQHNPRAPQLPPGRTLEGLRKLKAIPLLEGCEFFSPSPQILTGSQGSQGLSEPGSYMGSAKAGLVSRKDLSIWPVNQGLGMRMSVYVDGCGGVLWDGASILCQKGTAGPKWDLFHDTVAPCLSDESDLFWNFQV
jgi:hypothetical protein